MLDPIVLRAELERRRREKEAAFLSAPTYDGRLEPVRWIKDHLGITLYPAQAEIAESIRDHRKTAVRSCNSAGKDFTAAAIVVWFLHCFQPCKVVTTAPTGAQVKNILWSYIRKIASGAVLPLRGSPLRLFWEVEPDWYAVGFKSSDYNEDAAKGYHSEHILVVIDESTGVEGKVRAGLDSLTSSGFARTLDIANPTDPLCSFAQLFSRPDVNPIKISAFEHPNLKNFGIVEEDFINDTWRKKMTGPVPVPGCIEPEWVAEKFMAIRGNVGDPDWVANVRADFPTSAVNQLIPLEWIEAAEKRAKVWKVERSVRGIDVARLGKDEGVEATLQYGHSPDGKKCRSIAPLELIPKGTAMDTVGWIVARWEATSFARTRIDAVGLGSGVFDRVKEVLVERGDAKAEELVTEIQSGASAHEPSRFLNRRAEMWWALRDSLDPQGADPIGLPYDRLLREDLASIRYSIRSNGKKQIESKDEIKLRLGRSPDRGDAVMMAVGGGEDDKPETNDLAKSNAGLAKLNNMLRSRR